MDRGSSLRKNIQSERGTVTIYLVIVFIVMLIFMGLIVDLARIKIAQNQLRRAINAAARSVLSDYNTSLKNDFGLFVVKNQSAQQCNQDFLRYAAANLSRSSNDNFSLLDFHFEKGNLTLTQPISDPRVLEEQILGQMKYIAPIEISKRLLDKLKPLGNLAAAYQDQKKRGTAQDSTNPKFAKIRDLNQELTRKKQQIRDLQKGEQNHNQQGHGQQDQSQQIKQLEAEILVIMAEIKRLRNEIQQEVINLPDEPSLQELKKQEASYQSRFQAQFAHNGVFGYLAKSKANDFANNEITDQMADNNEQTIGDLVGLLDFETNVLKVRNDLYINEYILTYFNTLVDQLANDEQRNIDCEAEYVLYGSGKGLLSPQAKAVQQLYGTRFALDSLAYFVFSKAAPPDFLLRTIYALIRGALQASIDTYKLLSDPDNTVAVAEMGPSSSNPLATINMGLNYQDHLRLFMFLDALKQQESSKKAKLQRIVQLVQRKNGLDADKAYTLLDGNAEVSIKLWFFPLSGVSKLSNGPFGTEIKQGRAYINKSVELNY